MNRREAVAAIDAIDADDPERAHASADDVLLVLVHPDVAVAYQRLVDRCRWWAHA